MLYLNRKKKFRKDQIVTGNLLQYTGTPCPRTVTGFCRCFAFRIGKIHYHHCIVRNFQFRKFLPVYSNKQGAILWKSSYKTRKSRLSGSFSAFYLEYIRFLCTAAPLVSRVHILFDQPVKFHTVSVDQIVGLLSINTSVQSFSRLFDLIYQFFPALHISLLPFPGRKPFSCCK